MSTAHFTGTSGTPDSTTSYFMGGQFEVKDRATKKYYSIAGMMVAVNDGTGLQYLLTDHLGSTVAVTNQSGTLTSQQRYPSTGSGRRLPFGAARTIPNSPLLGTDFTYTGQRKLDDGMGGIMDYKARFYSPVLGRFLQPDTIIPDQFNPQGWNRFGYVMNNPVRFNDPTGHYCVGDFEDCIDGSGGTGPTPPVPPLGEGDVRGVDSHDVGCNGQTPSIVCLKPSIPEPNLPLFIPQQPRDHEGMSDPSFDGVYFLWEKIFMPFNDILSAEDMYRFTSRGGWRAARNSLNLGIFEALVQGGRQAYRDTWYQSLTPSQKLARPVVVAAEAYLTDLASGKVGNVIAKLGLIVGGPPGAAGGQLAGATATTQFLDNFWMETVNPTVFNFLGAWP